MLPLFCVTTGISYRVQLAIMVNFPNAVLNAKRYYNHPKFFSILIKYKQCNYTDINFHRAIKQYAQQNLNIKYSCRQELAFIKRYVKSLWAMGVDKRF